MPSKIISLCKKNCKSNQDIFYNIFYWFVSLLMFAVIIMMVIDPGRYMDSVLSGLRLFALSVLPSLFPFFFLSNILTEIGTISKLSRGLSSITNKLFRVPAISSYIFLMSILCGYPVGAKLIDDFYERGLIDEDEAKRILPLSSTSGPIFVIGAVGAGLLQDARLGAIIYASHIISMLFSAIILRKKKRNFEEKLLVEKKPDNVINKSINSSITSILAVGAYVSIFYMFIDMAFDVGLLDLVSNFVAYIISPIGIEPEISVGLSSGLIEMTRGCRDIATFSSNKLLQVVCCSGIVSFGGMSILMQSHSFLCHAKIKIHTLLGVKCVQFVISIFVSLGLGILLV